MQRLHVVGFTQDNQGLILSVRRGTKNGSYIVDVDSAFEEALTDLMKERGADSAPRIPRAESQLSVREMQQRLRSGQSIRQVARAAGVDEEWVSRFAVPIEAEQGQVVRQAFGLVMSKQRLGSSSQSLGTSVWWNLQDRSVQLDEEQWSYGWSAALLRDSRWVVKFEYEARKRKQVAEWEVDLKLATISSRNRLGSDLGYVESGRRRRPGPPPPAGRGLLSRPAPTLNEPDAPEPVVELASPSKKRAAKKRAAARATAKRAPATRAATKKAAAKKAAAKKAAAKKATVKKAAAKKASAQRTVAKKSPARSASARKTAAKKPAAKKPAARSRSVAKKAPAKKAAVAKRAPAKTQAARTATAAKKKALPTRPPAAKRVAALAETPTERVAVRSATATGPLRPPSPAPRISAVRALPAGSTPSPNIAPAVTPAPEPATRKRRSFLHR